MSQRSPESYRSGTNVLLVDDDVHYLASTQALLASEGYRVSVAHDAREALSILAETPVDVALIDYSMPQMSGAELIAVIRAQDNDVRIVLQTGSAEDQPEREILRRLDVHGLAEKADGPERLLLWTEVAAKSAHAARRLRQDARGMKIVIEAAACFHRMQPIAELGNAILSKVCECVGAARGVLVLYADVIGAGDEDLDTQGGRVGVPVATHDYAADALRAIDCTASHVAALAQEAVASRKTRVSGTDVALPLAVRETCLGYLILSEATTQQLDAAWLELLSYQASVAIQNALFYEMAAFDSLSGAHARRFFENWARRELRASLRSGTSCGLLYADLDGLKQLNDSAGHLKGDQAIRSVGRVLRTAIREHDIVGRLGGDEFAMLLPATKEEGAKRVGERILELLAEECIETPDGDVFLSASIGIVILDVTGPCAPEVSRNLMPTFYEDLLARLMIRADEALYKAKSEGRGRLCIAAPVEVPTPTSEHPRGAGEQVRHG
jgi:diguanylate cyclase (GGDEF)-like protein